MPITGFDHVIITAADIDATCAFYDKLFGLKVGLDYAPGGKLKVRQAFIGGGSAMFSIHQRDNGVTPVAMHPTSGSLDVCLRWSGTIEEAEALLKRHGVPIVEGPSPRLYSDGRPSLSVYFRDPDGNLIEIMAADPRPERAGDSWEKLGAAFAKKSG